MVSSKQYLEALDTIEEYNQQLRKSRNNKIKSWDDLKASDLIVFDKTMAKTLTIEKEYKVIFVGKDWKNSRKETFKIIDDAGRVKELTKRMNGYSMRLV